MRARIGWLGAVVCLLLASGCAGPGLRPSQPERDNLRRDDAVGRCARLYRDVDSAVASAGVQDAQAARVPGLPYLRINRFLAAISPTQAEGGSPQASPQDSAEAFDEWVDRLRALDRQARQAELDNLPEGTARADWTPRLDTCAEMLRRHDLTRPAIRDNLTAHRAAGEYQPILRVLGLYPLVSIPFMQGVRRLHEETRETFATPLAELEVTGTLKRVGPGMRRELSSAEVAAMLDRAAGNELGIPDPDAETRRRLLHEFAPVWEIDTASPADRPGRPQARADSPPLVTGEPVVFTHLSHARWHGRTLLQLNYVLWFPERPRQGAFDLVGGHLDGITWRVTLGMDGRPLLYDAMHNCGCYYKAFPTNRVSVVTRKRGWEEPISVPQTVPDGAGRLVLRVASTTHYLQRIRRDDGASDELYELADYDSLRSLPLEGGGRRSLFGPQGIVPGTRRPERWLFWPMGVPAPGAMRQWGNHAIAFVGRRHFDDPHLLETYFAPAE